MALAGKGAIIIWNDITPEGRDQFYDWHLHEHIPERLGVPGFRRGSRFIAAVPETKPEFLTLYEIDDPSVATSAPYLARLNNPTDWTKRATAHFRNTARALTEVVRSEGEGPGGVMGTISFGDAATLDRLKANAPAIAEIGRMPRITGAHLCLTNNAASAAKTVESENRPDIVTAPIGAVLIEGCDRDAVQAATSQLLKDYQLNRSKLQIGLYTLEHVRSNSR
jgi:hypothetical protein